MGTMNRFFPSFMHLGRQSSTFDITVHEDEVYDNDMSTYWTEATSRQKSRFERSSYGSYSSSYRSSLDDSSDDSSSEEEDDDCESYSLASNSTISTRASEINKRWGSAVDFNRSMLDDERRKYD